jgi:hypothetical protein
MTAAKTQAVSKRSDASAQSQIHHAIVDKTLWVKDVVTFAEDEILVLEERALFGNFSVGCVIVLLQSLNGRCDGCVDVDFSSDFSFILPGIAKLDSICQLEISRGDHVIIFITIVVTAETAHWAVTGARYFDHDAVATTVLQLDLVESSHKVVACDAADDQFVNSSWKLEWFAVSICTLWGQGNFEIVQDDQKGGLAGGTRAIIGSVQEHTVGWSCTTVLQ